MRHSGHFQRGARGDRAEQRRDHHGAVHGGAVGAGQPARALEDQHERAGREEHEGVRRRHVDLPMHVGRGLQDLDARQEVELHRLARDRERAGDRRLRGDDRGRGREQDQERKSGGRDECEERIDGGRGRGEEQCALPEVVEQQARPDDEEPGDAHGLLPEVAHVDVERLAARQHEEHGAEDRERDARVAEQHAQRVLRVEGRQDLRRVDDGAKAEEADRDEPQHHDRAEEAPDLLGAAALDRKKRDEDHERAWHHQSLQAGVDDRESLDRAQHRDRGRDERIAIEERRAEHREQHEPLRRLAVGA